MDRDNRAYLSGEITAEQWQARNTARGVGGLAAAAVVGAVIAAPEAFTAILARPGIGMAAVDALAGDALGGASLVGGGALAIKGADAVTDALSALRVGRSPGVNMVDSADELGGLFGRLSSSGKVVEGSNYPGRLVELPDGTTVGLRAESRSGGPTIDIKLPDETLRKVHVQQ